MVEMVFALLLFLPVVLGAVQFAWAMYTYSLVSDAAREGARWAIVRGNTACTNSPNMDICTSSATGATNTDIQNYIQGLGYPGIATSSLTASTNWLTASTSLNASNITTTSWSSCGTASACKGVGNQVQVTVTYGFPLMLPRLGTTHTVPHLSFNSSTLNISSTANMIIAQ